MKFLMKSYSFIITVLLLVITVNFTSIDLFYSTNSNYTNSSINDSINNTTTNNLLVIEKGTNTHLSNEKVNNFQNQQAGIKNVTIILTSSLGTDINYCSIIGFRLSWTIIPVINTQFTLFYMNSSYYISNSNYKYIIMNDPYNLKSFNVKFTLLVYDSNNNRFTKSINILFNPNSCGNNSYPFLNTKNNQVVYEGNKIPALAFEISTGIIIAIAVIIGIYYFDHRKRTG